MKNKVNSKELETKSNREDNKMENVIKNRSEILFVYDVTDANPNGDPNDENKPRIDEETRINIVTDVRLKRTIRDYLYKFKQKEIFIREIELEDGKIQDAKTRAKDFINDVDVKKLENMSLAEQKKLMSKNILQRCIDVRLFGATIPLELIAKGKKKKETEEEETEGQKSSLTFTGPVQFKFGRSLHKVNLTSIKGSGAFASKLGAEQKTFREDYILPYSLILFYGIVNENSAQETLLTNNDIDLLLEGIWNGTKNLISRSKVGQMPRLLLRIVYKEGKNFHIGELDKRIKFVSDKNDEEIRKITDGKLDITELISVLNKNKDKIEKIYYKADEYLSFILDGKEIKLEEALKDFSHEIIFFDNEVSQ